MFLLIYIYIIEPGPVHHLAIDIISNTSANISWHPPVSLNGVIISYHIVIRNLTHNISMSDWILESSDRHYIIDDLGKAELLIYQCYTHLFLIIEPFVPYEVDVVAETKAGKGNLTQKLFFTVQSGIGTVTDKKIFVYLKNNFCFLFISL